MQITPAAQLARQIIREAQALAATTTPAEVDRDHRKLMALGLTQADAARIAERIHFTN